MNRSCSILFLIVVLSVIPAAVQVALAQNITALTYQGVLKLDGGLATGEFDFIFTLYDGPDPLNDSPVALPESESGVQVEDGEFIVKIDFGQTPFDGQERWLQTCVAEAGTPSMICLSPLQEVTSAPYSTHAINADELDGLSATDFLRRTSGCEICIGHADADGSEPALEQCFDLSSTGRDDDDFLQLSGDVDGNDRLWVWMQCP